MIPVRLLGRVMRDRAMYGSGGSCFGVSDPSELRRPFSRSPIVQSESVFEEGYERYKLGKVDDELYPYRTIDRELAVGFKAQVLNSDPPGPKKFHEEWLSDKIPFSDLETREVKYIIERF